MKIKSVQAKIITLTVTMPLESLAEAWSSFMAESQLLIKKTLKQKTFHVHVSRTNKNTNQPIYFAQLKWENTRTSS